MSGGLDFLFADITHCEPSCASCLHFSVTDVTVNNQLRVYLVLIISWFVQVPTALPTHCLYFVAFADQRNLWLISRLSLINEMGTRDQNQVEPSTPMVGSPDHRPQFRPAVSPLSRVAGVDLSMRHRINQHQMPQRHLAIDRGRRDMIRGMDR